MARAPFVEGLLRRWLGWALQIALTVVVTWFILDRVGLGLAELRDVDRAAWLPDPLLAGAASLLLMLGYGASALLWGHIVRGLGGPRLRSRDSVSIFMIANLGRYVPGKVWQIAGLAMLAKGKGVPPATAATAGVLGQGLALIAAAALGLGAFLSAPGPARTWGLVGVVLVPLGLAVASVPVVFRALSRAWFRLARAEPPDGLVPARVFLWLALYAANWVVYAASFWVLSASFGLEGSPVAIASAFAAAYVLGYVMIFAPAGLGPREGFLIAFLTPHLGAASAGVLAVAARVWTTLVEILPAGAFWVAHLLGVGRAGPGEPSGEGRP